MECEASECQETAEFMDIMNRMGGFGGPCLQCLLATEDADGAIYVEPCLSSDTGDAGDTGDTEAPGPGSCNGEEANYVSEHLAVLGLGWIVRAC